MASEEFGVLPRRQQRLLAGFLNLANVREKQGIRLDQIASSTKISTGFLRAIEAEEYDKLPGGIFNTSYLRQYAAAVGYDEHDLLAHYHLITEPAEGEPVTIRKPARSFLGKCFRILAPPSRI